MTRHTTTNSTLAAALRHRRAGLSIFPIRADGTRTPTVKWSPFREAAPDENLIRDWFGHPDRRGIGIVCGAGSGGLEVIDFDDATCWDLWRPDLERQDPGLLGSLVVVRSPRPGYHVYYRAPDVAGNLKLACEVREQEGKTRTHTRIETRGEGGFVVGPGSPPGTHPSGRLYEIIQGGDLSRIPTVTAAQRGLLLELAMRQDRMPPRPSRPARPGPASSRMLRAARQADRPGDDFNRRAKWAGILKGRGWTLVRTDAQGVEYWRRPDKQEASAPRPAIGRIPPRASC